MTDDPHDRLHNQTPLVEADIEALRAEVADLARQMANLTSALGAGERRASGRTGALAGHMAQMGAVLDRRVRDLEARLEAPAPAPKPKSARRNGLRIALSLLALAAAVSLGLWLLWPRETPAPVAPASASAPAPIAATPPAAAPVVEAPPPEAKPLHHLHRRTPPDAANAAPPAGNAPVDPSQFGAYHPPQPKP